MIAYSLTKDFDPKRVSTCLPASPRFIPAGARLSSSRPASAVVVGNGGASGDRQEFTFSEGAGAVEMHTVAQPTVSLPPQGQPAYQQQQGQQAATAVLGVYNPVTGTYGSPQPQPQPAIVGYSPASPYLPYGHVAVGYPSQVSSDFVSTHSLCDVR